jgi:hypothetical protein
MCCGVITLECSLAQEVIFIMATPFNKARQLLALHHILYQMFLLLLMEENDEEDVDEMILIVQVLLIQYRQIHCRRYLLSRGKYCSRATTFAAALTENAASLNTQLQNGGFDGTATWLNNAELLQQFRI